MNTALLSGAGSAAGGAMGGLGGAAGAMPTGKSLYDSLGAPTLELSARSGTPDLTGLFQSTTDKYGLPPGYLARSAQIESSNNPNASNPKSSAKGLFQFVDSTRKQYGNFDPYNAAASTNAAGQLASDNAKMFRNSLGREPTAGELYLAHQQGAGGAVALLRDPNALAVDVLGRKAVLNNGGTPDMTAGQFAGKWINKFDKGGAPATQSAYNFSTGIGGFAGAPTGKTQETHPLAALLGGKSDESGLMDALGGGSSQQRQSSQWQASNNPSKAPPLAEYVAAFLKSRRMG